MHQECRYGFPKLVERVIKEGDDVTRKAGSEAMERQTVHSARTPEGTPIEVTAGFNDRRYHR